MASSYTPRSDTPGSGGLLRFTAIRDLQAAAMRRATTLAPVAGLQLHVSVSIPETVPKGVAATELRKVGRNFLSRLVDDARKLSRPTYRTGLFISSWKGDVEVDDDGRLTVRLRNPAPYAGFVHRRGEKGRTVVNTYIKPAVMARKAELTADVAAMIRRLLQRGRQRT